MGRALDDLGTTLIDVVHGSPRLDEEINGVVIHDPIDAPDIPVRSLILGVGLHDEREIVRIVTQLGSVNAAGLVIRAPVSADASIAEASAAAGVPVLGLTRGASWVQLAAMLRSLLSDDDLAPAGDAYLGGIPAGDLFTLANAIASLIDAPVTIEDRNSQVLAFSGQQGEADSSRIETILGRRVPEAYSRLFAERGVFRDLFRSDEPVWIDPLPINVDEKPRVAVAVRAGDELLGSIWAAVPAPLSVERTQALREAAKLAALHMLRVRAGADIRRQLSTDLLATALKGGAESSAALQRMGLSDHSVVVLALTGLEAADGIASEANLAAERARLTDGFSMHLGTVHPRCVAALVGDVVYGLLPVSGGHVSGEDRGLRIAQDFLERIGSRYRAVIGVSPVAETAAELTAVRSIADQILRVLRSRRPEGSQSARFSDVSVEALVLDLHDLAAARGDRLTGPVAALVAYDQRHNSDLVITLRAWLESFGNIPQAAAKSHVHPNTFRYRLRRLCEVADLDIDDADARFGVMLQLRVLASGLP
ncbi:MAG: PucR family transcriptional regulator [Propionibacteriaceae bacterium]